METAEKIFSELREDISVYVRLKIRLLKLTAIERTARVFSVLSHGIILLLLVFFTVLFLFAALGFYLGELLGSTALGFLIIGGLYLLLTLLLVGCRNGIRIRLMNILINAITDDEDEDNEDQSTDSSRTAFTGTEGNSAAVSGKGVEDF